MNTDDGPVAAAIPLYLDIPAPGEDTLPPPPSVNRATTDEVGCWADGVRGGFGVAVRVVDLAVGRGYTLHPQDRPLVEWARAGGRPHPLHRPAHLTELTEDVEQWMNDAIAPPGYLFGWHEGSFELAPIQQWCEWYGTCLFDLDHDHDPIT